MPWVLSNEQTQRDLERRFARDGVSFTDAGFCDSPEFLKQERRDARYLELYARYVEARTYDEAYLADAARKIAVVADTVRAAVQVDGRLGACVDASGMIGRMLDKLGVWNYVAKATLTIDFPETSGLSPRYFWAFDHGQFAAPHAVVIAPPYYVVDATVKYQPYDAGRDTLVPSIVLADTFQGAQWRPEDLANHDLLQEIRRRRHRFNEFLLRQNPGMASVLEQLPSRAVMHGQTRLKYAVVAVGGTVEPLEGITGYKPSGRTALTIFEQDVLPKLGLLESRSA
ncbi:hypothetical protein [Paraburkholderia aromaticivorans]|uniref:hypothetical protein n=1 Tax=Paraburkholderia aromaticivorans TaxID=2026199 RepID=UPI0038B9FE5C